MPPKKQKTLSHGEIWDDSALIQSWDEALEEYRVRDWELFIYYSVC